MLSTERLTLVPHRPEHFEAYAEFWSKDPGHFLRSLAPMHPADAWTRLLRHFGQWTAFGWGPFLCFDSAGTLVAEAGYAEFRRGVGPQFDGVPDSAGTLVAEAGYAEFRRGVGPQFDGVPEGMWKVDLAAQGKGYATEVMATITDWFDSSQSAPRTVCMIEPGNDASIRVATRLGFREFDSADYRGSAVTLYERVR